MFKDDELKDMADKIELPIKEGTWEMIEMHIPEYPTSRRFLMYWRSFALLFCVIALAITTAIYYTHKNTSDINYLTNSTVSSVDGFSNDVKREGSVSSLKKDNNKHEHGITPIISNNSKNTSTNNHRYIANKQPRNKKLPNIKTTTNYHDGNDIQSNSDSNKDILGENTTNDNTLASTEELIFEQYFKAITLNKKPYNWIFDSKIIDKLKLAQKAKYFIHFNYGILNSNIHIDPELMKLPKGQGAEVSLYNGIAYKKWRFSLGMHYAQFKQTTSMGNTYDTTFYQVFKPNFETVLPTEYAGRLHDTSKLYLSGTNHNKVNQEFSILGLSLNVGRTLVSSNNFSLNLHYGANYKLLKKANTFFYDSINKAAVPFTQQDKGIVFKNLLSSRVRVGLDYKITQNLNLEVSPFVDYFHKPFIKHYYKADFLNYGVSIGATYTFR